METIGKVNRYVCEQCRAVHGTINLNTGVTPFLIGCKRDDCKGMAQSSMYRLPAGEIACGWAWYRPTVEEFKRLTAEEQDHVLSGGLILSPLESVVPMREDDEAHKAIMKSNVDHWLAFVAAAYRPESEAFSRIVTRLKGNSGKLVPPR